jgi:uncharacterized phage infection (PIP) family protein YhgE
MRIDEIQSQQAVQESKQSKAPQSGSRDDAFALLLQSEIGGPGEKSAPGGAVSAPIIPPDLSIQSLISNLEQTPEVSQAISAVNGVLTQLDSLQSALQDNKTPKEINALIEQLNTGIAGMNDKTSGLPADHQLSDMAEELKVTAYMESVKWKRGDYL